MIDYDAAGPSRQSLSAALRDLAQGLRQRELWSTMAWVDIRQRYRRSVMGPFWLTLSLALFVVGLSITYGALFNISLREYLPYVTVGMVVWTLLSTLFLEGCTIFTTSEHSIKQVATPLSLYVYRLIWRSLIVLMHNAIILVAVLLIFAINPGFRVFEALAGTALILVNGVAFALLFGTLSARFRDIPPLATNIVQLLFFVTPLLWKAESLGERRFIADANPLFHLIEIVRAPLLAAPASGDSWWVALAFTVLNLVVATLIFARYRTRIAFWL